MPLPIILIVVVAAATGTLQVVGAITVAALTATGAYLVARRSTSGSVRTTDAATLWRAAERIREEQSLEIVALRERVAVLESALRTEIDKREQLEREVIRMRGTIDD